MTTKMILGKRGILCLQLEEHHMPTARGALTAASIDKLRYGVGGEGKNTIVNIHEAYNSNTNE